MAEEHSATLHDIKDAYVFWQEKGREKWLRSLIRPMEDLVEPLPKFIIKPTAVDAICHGADLMVSGVHKLDDDIRRNALVAMMTARGELVALGKASMSSSKVMSTDKGVAVRTERVLMDPGHYPKMWKFSTDFETDQED